MGTLTKLEATRFRSRLAMSLSNLGAFRLYWLPRERRIMARSVVCTRRFQIPAGAICVGIYEHGIPSRCVVEDLVDLIERKALARLPESAPPPKPPSVATSRLDPDLVAEWHWHVWTWKDVSAMDEVRKIARKVARRRA